MTQALSIHEEKEFPFSDKEFRFLAELASQRTGIVLAEHKKDMVYSRLVRRLRALRLSSFLEYCELFETEAGEEEIGNLVNAITTNLTNFFREKHHFDHLHNQLETLAKQASVKRLRIWSAACSAGMEPYSIAMVMRSAMKDIAAWDARILATDIDTNMLNTGVCGIYSEDQRKNIPQQYQRDMSVMPDNTIQMSDNLKSLISFKPLNLLEHWPMKGPFDVIFCRNVVIYFDKPTQVKLFDRMATLLKPDGWLYIGHSENLFNVCDRFELMERTIYRKVR